MGDLSDQDTPTSRWKQATRQLASQNLRLRVATIEPAFGPATAASSPARRSVAQRWASLICHAMRAERDLKTIGDWARYVGVGRTTLCECCRLVHLSTRCQRLCTHDARRVSLTRAMATETVLDFADVRP